MVTAPPVRWGFSPLDEELELLPGPFTPSLCESLVRLGTRMPFASVTEEIAFFLKVKVGEPTARRKTENAGQAYVETQTAKVEALESRPPESPKDEPKGPEVQLMSVDGAIGWKCASSRVPLVGKHWGEVKTLVLGRVGEPKMRDGELAVHSDDLSYFSRMTAESSLSAMDHETFGRLATVETYRRGTPTAKRVCAVNDGAEWEQKFVDLQRPDAVRILDFGHSAEHLSAVSQAIYGAETPEARAWLSAKCHELRHEDSTKVLDELRQLSEELAGVGGGNDGPSAVLAVVNANLEYFEKRREQIRYVDFERLGYPIGSGAVEGGNLAGTTVPAVLVVEVRLKGSGMHWANKSIDPMVSLRTAVCSDRWAEAWPDIVRRLRAQCRDNALARRSRRKTVEEKPTETVTPATKPEEITRPTIIFSEAKQTPPLEPSATQPDDQIEPPVKLGPNRPTANHPWRHMPVGRARRL